MSGWKQTVRVLLRRWLQNAPAACSLPWQWWGVESRPDGMFLHGVPLASLVQRYGAPLHVLNVPRLHQNLAAFRRGGAGISPEVYCSVKSYPVPGVIRQVLQAGAHAEVISEQELWLVRQLGLLPHQIIFNGPAKSDAALRWSVANRLRAIHINHPEELERVIWAARDTGEVANVGLRLTVGRPNQFGLDVNDSGTMSLVARILAEPCLHLVSLHGHRGGEMRTSSEVLAHVDPLLAFMRRVKEVHGWQCPLLDVGGSLAVPSHVMLSPRDRRLAWSLAIAPPAPDTGATLSPAAYSALVCDRIAHFCREANLPVPAVVMEPGRALVTDAQMLLSTVLDVRSGPVFDYAITDVGTAAAPGACEHFQQMGWAGRLTDGGLQGAFMRPQGAAPRIYRVVGPICHTGDVATVATWLPSLARGDVLAMMDTGAYFISDARSFSFPQAGVVAVEANGKTELLRRTETAEDMFLRDQDLLCTRQ